MARLDVLLRVVPCPACVRHHDGQQEAGRDRADQESAERLGPKNGPDCDGCDDGDQSGQDHLAHCAACADVDGTRVVRLGLALHQSLDLTELPSHLLHHCARGPSDRLHGQRREEERHQAAEQDAHEHLHVREIEHAHSGDFRVCRHERECGQYRRPDGEALAGGCGRIAERVERVRPLSDLRVETGLLRDSARVVCHGAVSVRCEGDAER